MPAYFKWHHCAKTFYLFFSLSFCSAGANVDGFLLTDQLETSEQSYPLTVSALEWHSGLRRPDNGEQLGWQAPPFFIIAQITGINRLKYVKSGTFGWSWSTCVRASHHRCFTDVTSFFIHVLPVMCGVHKRLYKRNHLEILVQRKSFITPVLFLNAPKPFCLLASDHGSVISATFTLWTRWQASASVHNILCETHRSIQNK